MVTPLIREPRRFHFTGQNLEKSGCGVDIRADKSYFIVMAEGEGDVVKELHTVNGLGNAFNVKHFVADLTVWLEVDIWILTAGWTDLIQLDFLKGTFSGRCLLGFGSVGGETLDEFLQFLDLFFLLLIGFLHLLDHQLTGFIPEIVVAGVKLDFGIINISDMGTDFVQEITVMGDNDNGIVKVDQELFKPRVSRSKWI